ncbi:protein of unknown function [Cupriavidus taiwanensis]|uniref:Uncharacterized protein n=1 Tax=Cupriavidus taiwanensis TaxID=164546 RepID=A0A375IGI7_9BURK|nr:hypothetical protein [Cupriavidus taiwanensis]SPK73697.1 protein of unknown function [Cupriavidus taiwanensis]
MARARNIKPGIFKNEILGVSDPIYSLLFEGLWLLADREGRLEDRPLRIRAEVFPYRDGLNVDDMLSWLYARGFITRYSVNNRRYIAIPNFRKHQNPHKNEPASTLPAPDSVGATPEQIGTTSDELGTAPDVPRSAPADSLFSDSLIPCKPPTPPTGGVCPLAPNRKSSAKRKTPMPEDFGISERVERWAIERRYGNLPAHLESFRNKCAAHGYRYVDWDQAFMSAIREDWAGLRKRDGGKFDPTEYVNRNRRQL